MPAISVIAANFNGKHFLKGCLGSLESQTFADFEVILVDNGSSDGSVEYVNQAFPSVKIISLPENVGFCAGNNIGIKAAQGEYICLLNNDTQVDSIWLEELKRALDRNSDVGVCASKMLLQDRPDTIDAAGDVFYSCGIGGNRGHFEPDDGRFAETDFVFGACAGAAIYRRNMLEDIGLLDEDFFAYGEDTDLSFRAQLRGYRCLFVPTAVVYHVGGGTMKHASDQRRYLSHRNRLYTLIKDMPGDLLLKHLFPIVCYSFLRDVSWILQGKWHVVRRAWLDGLRNSNRMLEKRKEIQQGRKVSSHYIDSLLIKKWWLALR